MEVHVKCLATEKKGVGTEHGGRLAKCPLLEEAKPHRKRTAGRLIQALIFLPLCPDDVKLPVITDYDDHDVSGVYVFVHTCAVAFC